MDLALTLESGRGRRPRMRTAPVPAPTSIRCPGRPDTTAPSARRLTGAAGARAEWVRRACSARIGARSRVNVAPERLVPADFTTPPLVHLAVRPPPRRRPPARSTSGASEAWRHPCMRWSSCGPSSTAGRRCSCRIVRRASRGCPPSLCCVGLRPSAGAVWLAQLRHAQEPLQHRAGVGRKVFLERR
jgi:hypothetical protein